jgi:hypothetical protein
MSSRNIMLSVALAASAQANALTIGTKTFWTSVLERGVPDPEDNWIPAENGHIILESRRLVSRVSPFQYHGQMDWLFFHSLNVIASIRMDDLGAEQRTFFRW